jgi:AcrR family transcriptional regulator
VETRRTAGDERARLIVALAEIASAEPYRTVAADEVAARAELSPEAFHRHFATVEDCLVEAYESFGAAAIAAAIGSCGSTEDEWAAAVHASLGRLLRLLDAESARSRLCLAEVAPQQPRTALIHERTLRALTELLASHAPPLGRASRQITAEIIAGGVLVVLRQALAEQEPARLEELLPRVTFIVLAPFVGSPIAQRIADS